MRKSPVAFEATAPSGPIGPVAVFVLAVLLALSPLMRGGNRHVALIALEAISLLLVVLCLPTLQMERPRWSVRSALLAVLLTSPAWLAAVYLVPLPLSVWTALPGHGEYAPILKQAGIDTPGTLTLSLVPYATAASLFSGVPLAAALLAGYRLRLNQVQLVLTVVVALAFVEVVFGLLQLGSGSSSPLLFDLPASNRAFGTFANPNHFANYLAMALTAYIWLAWTRLSHARVAVFEEVGLSPRMRRVLVWTAGGVFLLIGILISRSRGAMLAGLPAALFALGLVTSVNRGRKRALVMTGILLLLAMAIVGFDFVLSRFNANTFETDASFRGLLAETTFQGAWHFWPFGAGWGTYPFVYPRFQPASIVGFANQAHQDYAQLLFEGGIFALILMGAFAWLAGTRAVELVRAGMRRKRLRREEMVSALCGLGLLGFLLHSLVEFNMHIPANAIMAALLAGVYLRPLDREERHEREDASDD